jgi:sterol desaturase/sphingolipid hydroxylase (fatty acid hydroxylase superfamily)
MGTLRRIRAFTITNGAVFVISAIIHFYRVPFIVSTLVRNLSFLFLISTSAYFKPAIGGTNRDKGPGILDMPRFILYFITSLGIQSFTEAACAKAFVSSPVLHHEYTSFIACFIAPIVIILHFVLKSFAYEVVFDFFHYWIHRSLHRIPELYQFHKLHHRFFKPTAVCTFCQHPLDLILTNSVPSITALAIVFSAIPLCSFEYTLLLSYQTFVEIAGHAGVETRASSFPQCRAIPDILGISLRSNDHDLHHSNVSVRSCNFSKRFILWDRVFGTYINKVQKNNDTKII